MKRAIVALALLSAANSCYWAANAATETKRVGDFSLLDQQGYFHQMSYYDDHKAIAGLIRHNDRLGMNVRWASDLRKEINSVYAAGKSIAFLPADPSPTTIYEGGK